MEPEELRMAVLHLHSLAVPHVVPLRAASLRICPVISLHAAGCMETNLLLPLDGVAEPPGTVLWAARGVTTAWVPRQHGQRSALQPLCSSPNFFFEALKYFLTSALHYTTI